MALEPITRQEQIIAGKDLEPITRMEKFLKEYGGGGVTDYTKLENKPTETIGGDTLTWDGNTEGRVVVGGIFCKVSDAQPTKDDFADGASGVYGGTEPGEIAYSAADIAEPCDGMILLFDLAIVVHDKAVGVDASGDGMVFSESGTYFVGIGSDAYVASLTIPGYTGFTKEVLKKEVLPKATAVANAAGSTPTAAEYNALLTALRDAGYLAT